MWKCTRKINRTKFDKKVDIIGLLERFINSGETCAVVKSHRHSSPMSCRYSINAAINRQGLHHIKVIQRDNEIYLINTLFATTIIP